MELTNAEHVLSCVIKLVLEAQEADNYGKILNRLKRISAITEPYYNEACCVCDCMAGVPCVEQIERTLSKEWTNEENIQPDDEKDLMSEDDYNELCKD